ncbi:MAG: 4Fe-4S binding protein [Candidatus Methanofastidiosia archaeon]
MSWIEDGFFSLSELEDYLPKHKPKKKVAVIECLQEIPCNACFESCKFDAVLMKNIIDVPKVDFEKCTGCMACIKICPGLAIFMVQYKNSKARVTIPYEFLSLPKRGDEVKVLDREGKKIGVGRVVFVLDPERNAKTALVTLEVKEELANLVRNLRVI